MKKKAWRYFAGFIDAQQRWLNKMAQQGWRLADVGKLVYTFEPCRPGEVQYCVDFVAHRSYANEQEYKRFLEDLGYRVFFKNINLQYGIGKAKVRLYGERGGKVSTSPGSYNKELLIVEKANDGKPFALHTTNEDKLAYYRHQRNAYLSITLLWLFFAVLNFLQQPESWGAAAFGLLALVYAIPLGFLHRRVAKAAKESILNQ